MSSLQDFIRHIQSLPRASSAFDVYSLERIKYFLKLLGNPENSFMGIHVAGTNGKGSTSMMIASILGENYKVGLYTSPHLTSYSERFRIVDHGIESQIPMKILLGYLEDFRPVLDRVEREIGSYPTWFEIITALSFQYFSDENVDYAVIEVGLGGRLDATNVRDFEYKVFTPICLDHQSVLGESIKEIVDEKSGILREHSSREKVSVLSNLASESKYWFDNKANENNIRYFNFFETARIPRFEVSLSGMKFDLELLVPFNKSFQNLEIPLFGMTSIRNATLATMTVLQMVKNEDANIREENLRHGLERTIWPGRFEILRSFQGGESITVLDGAHNVDAFEALRETLYYFLKLPEVKNLPKTMIFATKKEREEGARNMIDEVARFFDKIIITTIGAGTNSADLSNQIKNTSWSDRVVLEPELEKALEGCQNAGQFTLVTGSLYLIGEAKKTIGQYTEKEFLDADNFNADALR